MQQAKAIYTKLLPVPVVGALVRIPVRAYKALFVQNNRQIYLKQQSLENAVSALRTDVDLLARSVDSLARRVGDRDKTGSA